MGMWSREVNKRDADVARVVVCLRCITVSILVVKLSSATRPRGSRAHGIPALFLLAACYLKTKPSTGGEKADFLVGCVVEIPILRHHFKSWKR